MQEITAREGRALEEGDEDRAGELRRIEEEFLNKHLARWVPDFCRKIAAAAELPFYKGIARLTGDFIDSEARATAGAPS